jgi:hypothetical protein
MLFTTTGGDLNRIALHHVHFEPCPIKILINRSEPSEMTVDSFSFLIHNWIRQEWECFWGVLPD